MDKRYYPYSDYLKETFKERVFKITIDGGFSCPNRDGTISNGGCIFCDEVGSFSMGHDSALSIEKQVKEGINYLKTRHNANKFLAYFQAFTNTYKPKDELKKIYDSAFCDPSIVGISIGTRPDCVEDDKLDLISSYPYPQIEFGLQTIHDSTLKLINRGHDYKTFEDAYLRAKKRNIKVCVHLIFGLPNETRTMMLETAKRLGELEVDGVKFHALTILKGSKLEKYKDEVRILSELEYCELVCESLQYLSKKTTIQRVAGSGLRSLTLEPKWINHKFHTQNLIDKIMWEKDIYQGDKWGK